MTRITIVLRSGDKVRDRGDPEWTGRYYSTEDRSKGRVLWDNNKEFSPVLPYYIFTDFLEVI